MAYGYGYGYAFGGSSLAARRTPSFPPGYAVLTIGGAAVTDAQGRVYIVREDALQ